MTGRAGCSVTVGLKSLSDSNHNTLLGIVRASWPVPSLLHATSYFVWVSKCHLLQVTSYASPWDLCPGTPLSRALPPQVLDVNNYCVVWFIPVHAAGGRAGHCCGAGSPAWHHTWWARGRQWGEGTELWVPRFLHTVPCSRLGASPSALHSCLFCCQFSGMRAECRKSWVLVAWDIVFLAGRILTESWEIEENQGFCPLYPASGSQGSVIAEHTVSVPLKCSCTLGAVRLLPVCRQCDPPAPAWEAGRCGCRAAGQPEEASCKVLCFNPHPQLLVWPDLHLEHHIQTKAMPLPLTCPFAFCSFAFIFSVFMKLTPSF